MHTRRLVGALLAASLMGCGAKITQFDSEECMAGPTCGISGTLSVESIWQASLDVTDDCYALALSEEFYASGRELSGAQITVFGDIFDQPEIEAGTASYGYLVEGMRVNSNLCSKAIFVQEIRAENRVLWRAK